MQDMNPIRASLRKTTSVHNPLHNTSPSLSPSPLYLPKHIYLFFFFFYTLFLFNYTSILHNKIQLCICFYCRLNEFINFRNFLQNFCGNHANDCEVMFVFLLQSIYKWSEKKEIFHLSKNIKYASEQTKQNNKKKK
jgi:hypothetical protein